MHVDSTDPLFFCHFSPKVRLYKLDTSGTVHTSSYHTLALHLQLLVDVPLKDDAVPHHSFLVCLEILCHRKCKELEVPIAKDSSQAVLEMPTLQKHAADDLLWRKMQQNAIKLDIYISKLLAINCASSYSPRSAMFITHLTPGVMTTLHVGYTTNLLWIVFPPIVTTWFAPIFEFATSFTRSFACRGQADCE